MLITLFLWKSGTISAPHFYISGYLEEQRNRYLDLMRNVSVTNDWTSWCVFFLEALEKQAIRNLMVSESIRQLYEEMKIKFKMIMIKIFK
jgi:Fic family protein